MNKKSIESSFSFNEYIIRKSLIEINDNYVSQNSVDLDFDLETNFALNDENDKAIVILICEVFKDYREKNLPFNVIVEIVGKFSLQGDHSSEEIRNLCKVNATAILFPYLRAFISHLTSLSGLPNFLLPTVNVNKLLEKNNNNIMQN